jgi:hypothetical protein
MSKSKQKALPRVFNTDRRIRLGIWGLGRGMSFYKTCNALNLDVVAGCDYNQHMRDKFVAANPGAFVTANAEEFLAQDFDAVLLATYCPAHAGDAIQCLQAGKHVMSEVTAFYTMAEGVRLVEEVEKRKLVYSLAENYPFTAANMWLASRWREGLFGELVYAEYEYVHECRNLCYTYIDGVPVVPGHTVHNWRSWLNYHYYCTHSLGPVMVITGTRPVQVESFPVMPKLAGYLGRAGRNGGTMTPSLIRMDNGGVVRNLMGATTNDTHQRRLWGTLGAAESDDHGVRLRLGGTGGSPKMEVAAPWEGLGELAAKTGHGGGDFWTLYYFAREILTGEKGPFDIYGAADVTIPGILACRSSHEGGRPYDVPDFRKKTERAKFRSDHWIQDRYDVMRGVFGGAKLTAQAGRFTTIMNQLVKSASAYRAYADWKKMQPSLQRPAEFLPVAEKAMLGHAALQSTYREARQLIKAYPGSDGARVLSEMLDLGEEKKALAPSFLPALRRDVAALRRKYATRHPYRLERAVASPLIEGAGAIDKVLYPARGLAFTPIEFYDEGVSYHDIRSRHGGKRDGLVYARGFIRFKEAVRGSLRFGADGPVKVFVNRKAVGCDPKATNPVGEHLSVVPVAWKQGKNEIVVAMRTCQGKAWGFTAEGLPG